MSKKRNVERGGGKIARLSQCALAVLLGLGLYLPASAARESHAGALLSAPAAWAAPEVEAARTARLLPAGLDMDYGKPATRLDFAKLVSQLLCKRLEQSPAELLKASPQPTQAFPDSTDPAVSVASAYGIVQGDESGRFLPEKSITRQEAATMLGRLADVLWLPTGEMRSFSDAVTFADWATEAITRVSALVTEQGSIVMGGTGGGAFSPLLTYTREQAFCSFLRMYQIPSEEAGEAPGTEDPLLPSAQPLEILQARLQEDTLAPGETTRMITEIVGRAAEHGYASSNAEVAGVDISGTITARGPGTAIITFTAKDAAGKVLKESYTLTVRDGNPAKPPQDPGLTAGPDDGEVKNLLELCNREREKQGLSPLIWDAQLARAAEKRLAEVKIDFSINRPNGQGLAELLLEFGLKYGTAAQNLGRGKTAQAVFDYAITKQTQYEHITDVMFDRTAIAYDAASEKWVQIFYESKD